MNVRHGALCETEGNGSKFVIYMIPKIAKLLKGRLDIAGLHESLKEVERDGLPHLEDLTNFRLLLGRLFALLKTRFEMVPINILDHILDTKVPIIIDRIGPVPIQDYIIYMAPRAMDIRDVHVPGNEGELAPVGQATAWNVPGFTGEFSVIA